MKERRNNMFTYALMCEESSQWYAWKTHMLEHVDDFACWASWHKNGKTK